MRLSSWHQLPSSELLKLKWKDLNLSLEQSEINFYIQEIYSDLKAKGFLFKPKFFVSDGWYVSLGDTAIAVPFYLLHPRLKHLEIEIMGRIEGDRASELRRLIRHELGHSIDHAYKLQSNIERTQLFGPSQANYPESYSAHLLSAKNYVQYLGQNYASSHPDEDWAETFAVWFDSRIHWRLRYPSGMARRKLNFMNRLMGEIKSQEVLQKRSIKKSDLIMEQMTLKQLYQTRLNEEKRFYNFKREGLETILVKKDENAKLLSPQTKQVLSDYLAQRVSCTKKDLQQVINNLEISLWRKGLRLNVKREKDFRALSEYFNQNLALYIGKEKNNILM